MDKLKKLFSSPEKLIYLYFFIAASYLACIIKFGVAPDESFHYGFIKFYAGHSIDPFLSLQSSSFHLGELSREPAYLYHYLLSFPYRLSEFLNINALFLIKVINITLGLLSLIALNKLALILNVNRYIRLIVLFFIANIPMFLFLSASINYDNLMILLSILSLILLIQLTKKFSPVYLLALLIIMALGPLVKNSFMPISFVTFIFLVPIIIKNKTQLISSFAKSYKKSRFLIVFLVITSILSAGLFTERYVSNYLEYGTYAPKCHKLIEIEKCRQNPLFANGEQVNKYAPKIESVNPVEYLSKWLKIMNARIFGLFGHQKFDSSEFVIKTGMLILLLTFFLSVIWFRFKKELSLYIIPLTFLVYTAALILINLKTYKNSSDIDRAVQGRYWLPVLLPFFIYVASLRKFKPNPKNPLLKVILVILVIGIFTMGIPNILHGIDQNWLK